MELENWLLWIRQIGRSRSILPFIVKLVALLRFGRKGMVNFQDKNLGVVGVIQELDKKGSTIPPSSTNKAVEVEKLLRF